MKVIKAPPEFKPIKLKCTRCTAELEAELSDFKRDVHTGDQREMGSSYDHAVATCPICGSGVFADRDQFPVHVYDKLPRINNGSSYGYYKD